MTRSSLLRYSAFALVAALAIAGCDARGSGATGGPPTAPPPPGAVQRARPPVSVFGVVVADVSRTIAPGFSARIAEVVTREGREVARGDVLIRLDMDDYDREVESLARRRRRSELRIADLTQRLAYARSDDHDELVDAQIALDGSQDLFERARADLRRNEQLASEGAVSRRAVDDARDRLGEAERALDRSRLRLRTTRDRLVRSASDLETEIELERLELDALQRDIARLRSLVRTDAVSRPNVVSPFEAGIVAEVAVQPGDQVGPGSRLVRIIDRDTLVVSADLPEEFLRDVTIGAAARIVALADRRRSYTGVVLEIARQARRVGNETVVTARISIDNRDAFLLPGMNVDVAIQPRD